MKSEEEIYNEILEYINKPAHMHKRPCTLASIKKIYRTNKIIDLIFSRPDVFVLSSEIKHVPIENMTEELAVKFVLSNPKRFVELDESFQTIPVMVAFELAKRRYEHISARMWGSYGEKIYYPEKLSIYINSISDMCDKLSVKFDDEKLLRNYLEFIKQGSEDIKKMYCSCKQELEKEEQYEIKYNNVDFDLDKRLFILISGVPDAGKTTLSQILASRINDSMWFDSDMLLEKDLVSAPLSTLIDDNSKVVIFSDITADTFFKNELGDAYIVNILIKPSSIEKRYRNSKYMQNIQFKDYKESETDKYSGRLNAIENPIIVINDYTSKLNNEINMILEEIASRFGVELSSENECVLRRSIPNANGN